MVCAELILVAALHCTRSFAGINNLTLTFLSLAACIANHRVLLKPMLSGTTVRGPTGNNSGWSNNIAGKGEEKNDNTKINADSPLNHSNSQQTDIDKEAIGYSTTKTEPNTILIESNQSNTSGQDIHNIANRLYPCSDTWLCKNCNERGDRWHILNHLGDCKMNKK